MKGSNEKCHNGDYASILIKSDYYHAKGAVLWIFLYNENGYLKEYPDEMSITIRKSIRFEGKVHMADRKQKVLHCLFSARAEMDAIGLGKDL